MKKAHTVLHREDFVNLAITVLNILIKCPLYDTEIADETEGRDLFSNTRNWILSGSYRSTKYTENE